MNTIKAGPKDFFLWVGAMLALYGSAVSFVALLFEYINYAYPDPLIDYYVDPFSGGIRFAMAALIVLAPLTIILMRLIRRDIARTPEKNDLWVRRWALYLTLFIAGGTIVIDLITLINTFLGGELSMRFGLKVVVVLLVAGAAFLHFLSDLWGYWGAHPRRAQVVGYAVLIAVLASIISGFFIMGTPGEVRLYRYDNQKVSDLQAIQWQIINYWQQKESLPADLQDIEDPLSGFTVPVDPQSGDAYEYKRNSPLDFSLCATFNTATPEREMSSVARPVGVYGESAKNETWKHAAGAVCFDRSIDPDRYPPYPKI